MAEWVSVATQDDWARLNDIARGFHDGVVRQFGCLGGDYINEHLELVYGAGSRLWLLIQLQCKEAPTVELLFTGVLHYDYDPRRDAQALMDFKAGQVSAKLLSVTLVAKTCQYRLGDPTSLGSRPSVPPEALHTPFAANSPPHLAR